LVCPLTELGVLNFSSASKNYAQSTILMATSHVRLHELPSDIRVPLSVSELTIHQLEFPLGFGARFQLPASSLCYNKWGWESDSDFQEPLFRTTTFKNSHFHPAHYANPNFQPEEWLPETEYTTQVEGRPKESRSKQHCPLGSPLLGKSNMPSNASIISLESASKNGRAHGKTKQPIGADLLIPASVNQETEIFLDSQRNSRIWKLPSPHSRVCFIGKRQDISKLMTNAETANLTSYCTSIAHPQHVFTSYRTVLDDEQSGWRGACSINYNLSLSLD
jgi:hypothetical protein